MKFLFFVFLANFIPFFCISQQNPDDLRIAGIPFGYLFWLIFAISCFWRFLILSSRRISNVSYSILLYWYFFSFFLFLINVLLNNGWGFVSYVISLSIYPTLFVTFYETNRVMPLHKLNKIVKKIVLLYSLFIICGAVAYFLGYKEDGNYFMFYNRNATALSAVVMFSVVLSLYDKKQITNLFFIVLSGIWFMGFLALQSRAGFLCWILLLCGFYYFKNKLRGILVFFVFLFFGGLMLTFFSGDHLISRIHQTQGLVTSLFSDNVMIFPGDGDYRRFALLNAGIDIVKEKLFFGTGFSPSAYIDNFNEDYYITYAGLPHNLYISYLAEMGVFMFFIFILGGYLTFKTIIQSIAGKALVVSFMIYMLFNEYFLLPDFWVIASLLLLLENKNKMEVSSE